jgi:hypothetical protein
MSENEAKVKAFSDTVAGLAIVLGAATGNWVAVLAGSASLAINHWDGVKKSFSDTGPYHKAFDAIKNDPNLRGIWDSVKQAWQGAVDSFRKGTADIGPKVTEMFQEWKKAWNEWAPIIKAWWEGFGKPVFSALGSELAFRLQNFVIFATGVAFALDKIGEAIKVMWGNFSQFIGLIINGAAKAFGWIPGIGPKLERAAADFNAFRDRVNKALDGINDEDVYINVKQRGAVGVTGSNEAFNLKVGRRAHGGVTGGGWTELHEMGREAVRLPSGATVIPHGQTEQMINSGAARSKLDLVVSFQSTGDPLIDEIMRGLRFQVRANGGVDQAFA